MRAPSTSSLVSTARVRSRLDRVTAFSSSTALWLAPLLWFAACSAPDAAGNDMTPLDSDPTATTSAPGNPSSVPTISPAPSTPVTSAPSVPATNPTVAPSIPVTNMPTATATTTVPTAEPTTPPTAPSTPSTSPMGSGGTPPVMGTGGMDNGGAGAVGIGGMNVGGSLNTGGMNSGPVVPSVAGSDYSLVMGDVTLVANGPNGRITQLNVNGGNLLTTSAVNPLNFGSSFWTAPQSVWSWPPPLDAVTETVLRTDYVHAIDGNSILFSTPNTTQGSELVSISKRFSADVERGAFVLEHIITNAGAAQITTAPWEITRVVPQGLTFYPTGTSVGQAQIPTTDNAGVTWLDYAAAGISNQTKNIADGAEGWLAHVNGGVLFLKVFPEISAAQAAPAEGEIEIYIDTLATYVELEQQGAYAPIAAGASSTPWQVLWVVRAVPAEVQVAAGSASLVDWVRGIVAAL